MMVDSIEATGSVPGVRECEPAADRAQFKVALVESIAAVSLHVGTGRAAADFVRAGYDRTMALIPITSRKRLGRLLRCLEGGWTDLATTQAAAEITDEVVAELVAIGKRVKNTIGGPLILLASGLTLFAVVQHAVHWRITELQEVATDAGDQTAGGMQTEDAPGGESARYSGQ